MLLFSNAEVKTSVGGGGVGDGGEAGERVDEMEEKKRRKGGSAVWGGGIKRHLNAGERGGWERKDCEGIAH